MLLQCLNLGGNRWQDINMHASNVHTQLMIFLTAVPVLLGVLLVRRDIFNPVYEWSLGFPVTNRVLIASKWIAGYLYCWLFIVFVQAAYLFAAYEHQLAWYAALQFLIFFTFLYAMSFGVALSLGMLLGALMPLRFSLPIAFCGWIFGSVFVPLFLSQIANLYPLNAFSLNHLMNASTSSPIGAWSLQLQKMEHRLLLAINVAFGLFMLTAASALLARVRPVRRPKVPHLVMWTALLVAIASLVPYGGLWADRYERAGAARAVKQGAADERQEPYMFSIKRMAIDVTRHPDNSLIFKAVIELPTAGGKPIPAAPGITEVREHVPGHITFLLYPQLKVSSITVDGKAASWRQDHEQVSFDRALLTKNQNTHVIEFQYSGTLHEWALAYDRSYYRGFVDKENVYLPAALGWYPIAGAAELFAANRKSPRNREDAQTFAKADLELTMTGFPGMLYASIPPATDDKPEVRHWKMDRGDQLFVLGGQFETVRLEGEPVSVITTASSIQASKRFLEMLKERRAFFEAWTDAPLNRLRQIIYLPMGQTMSDQEYIGVTMAGDTLLVNQSLYNSILDRMPRILNMMLFGDIIAEYEHIEEWDDENNKQEETYSIIQELRQLISFYMWQKHLDPGTVGTYSLSPVHEKMLQMVDAAYNNGQEELVRRVLLRFYEQGLKVTYLSPVGLTFNEAEPVRFIYPTITWKDWLKVWNEEKGR